VREEILKAGAGEGMRADVSEPEVQLQRGKSANTEGSMNAICKKRARIEMGRLSCRIKKGYERMSAL
jgi:hypothetical protein